MSAFAWRGFRHGLWLAIIGASSIPRAANASWAQNRTDPSAREIAVVDATGEAVWPYGAEDIAGDGLSVFTRAEQARDVRTLYAATDATRLWLRLYVSDATAAATDLTAFVFVDADRNQQTGGPATGAELDPTLPADPSGGGYDAVVAFRGDGTQVNVFAWNATARAFAMQPLMPNDSMGEVGRAVDPILLGSGQHGYLEVALRSDLLGVAQTCDATLFARTVNTSGQPGGQDVNVGGRSACVPVDRNNDGVPDVVVTPGCTLDSDCPLAGICVARRCVIAPPCTTDADCAADSQCSANGLCVARPGPACSVSSSCGDLVCQNNRCSACSATPNDCAAGFVCAPNGRCVSNSGPNGLPAALAPGEKVQGGAFHCSYARDKRGSALGALLLALALGFVRRARRADPRS